MEKYSDLAKDLEVSGFRVKLMSVEVGARGLVGKSAYTFLTQIGLSSRERTKAMTKMSEAACQVLTPPVGKLSFFVVNDRKPLVFQNKNILEAKKTTAKQ